ncbi:MAG: hypothetical protein V4515_14920 [Chloroflexota bacterium]
MTTRDVGDQITLEHPVYDADGDPIAATVVLTVTSPSGATSTPTVSTPTVGIYRSSFTLTAAGTWFWVWTVSGTVVDVETGQITAANPAAEPYASITLLRAAVGMEPTDTTRDALLTMALNGASRGVEDYCDGREPGAFWLDTAATARVFTLGRRVQCSRFGETMRVDDIGSTSGLVVEVGDGTTFTTLTDCETLRDNALLRGLAITALFSPSWSFSCHRKLRVTARWGWPRVPDQIEQSTLLQASRLYRRKDSPEGVAGSADWGLVRVPNLDPDVKALLANFKILMAA